MLCRVLGLLVLPTVSPLVPGVSACEGVVWCSVLVLVAVLVWVSQLVVLGFGVLGWVLLGVGARHSWLRAWWVYPCVLPVFLAALQLPWRGVAGFLSFGFSCVVCVCGAGGARALVCHVRLWGSCRRRLWRCVLCARMGVCAVCWWCIWVPVLAFLGSVGRLCVGAGAVCRSPSPAPAVGSGCGSPPPLAGVCLWWCVPPSPLLRALTPLSLCRVARGGVPLVPCPAFPAVVGGGGGRSLTLARVPSPGVSPWGGRCLHSPSGCNSVVRAVHLYPLGTNGLAP